MRCPRHRLVRGLLVQAWAILGLASVCLAGDDRPAPAASATGVNAGLPTLAATGRNVTRVAVHAPGQYASEVLAVFKMRIGRFLPDFGLDEDLLRPYLLGGRTVLRLPVGRTVGEDLPGGPRATALHIGAGAELRLQERLFLSMDVGEMLHSGALSARSYTTYRLGLLFDF